MQVCVTDFNDHPPKFVSPPKNFTIRVPEDEEVKILKTLMWKTKIIFRWELL